VSRWLLLVAVVGLAGCNQLYGLDETIGPPPPAALDSDKDGVADEDDNCVLVANADQANGDADTLGDVCDPCVGPQSGIDADKDGIDDTCDACPTGSNHNEDGDTLLDGCDNCPGADNEDQLDTDGDQIGDHCDRSALVERRTFFDAFAPPDPMWNTGFSTWTATGESFTPAQIQYGSGPWNPRADVEGSRWQVTVSLRLPTTPIAETTTVGLQAVRATGSSVLAPGCTLLFTNADGWVFNGNDMIVQVTEPLRITLEVSEIDSQTIRATCWVNDQFVSGGSFPQVAFHPTIYVTDGNPEVFYFDVVQQ
jgi:hypothetical protein